jgi:hypothetical protein
MSSNDKSYDLKQILNQLFPALAITVGYIGNVGFCGRTYIDDRRFLIFTNMVMDGYYGKTTMSIDYDPAESFERSIRRVRLAAARHFNRAAEAADAKLMNAMSEPAQPSNVYYTDEDFAMQVRS